jgi:hypothetical protein
MPCIYEISILRILSGMAAGGKNFKDDLGLNLRG